MHYLCLSFQDEQAPADAISGVIPHIDLVQVVEELRATGNHIASSLGIPPATATTVRVRNGRMVLTDGQTNSNRSFLSGFVVIRARDLNEAVRLAARNPQARIGSVEVHPLTALEIDTLTSPSSGELTTAEMST